MIARKSYMEQLIGLRDKNLIKVLTGVRRCGKSTAMQMFRDYLIADGVSENQIVLLDFFAFFHLPGGGHLRPPQLCHSGLHAGAIQNIIQKDVPVRNRRQNEEHFSKTTAFLFDSIGSAVSPKKITSTLQSKSGISLSHNTVISYISALVESYMFYKVNRFDLRGRGLPDSN